MRFSPEFVETQRRALLRRGRVLAGLLSDVLAGKQPPALEELLRPGIRPEEALRKALDQVERRRELLEADDDRYGRCDTCGVDLGETVLTEMPWADRCEEHRVT